jgi:hypothetical protein
MKGQREDRNEGEGEDGKSGLEREEETKEAKACRLWSGSLQSLTPW